ncbi:MAG: hypothetical protein WAL75_13800 [Terracidiphilus sp.]
MRASPYRCLAFLAVASFSLSAWGQVSPAQNTASDTDASRRGPQPYSAEFTVSTVKTLADGSTITQESTEVEALDALGRTMIAITSVPTSSDEPATTKVSVFDPVAGSSLLWNSQRSVATLTKRPLPQSAAASCTSTSDSVSAGGTQDGPLSSSGNEGPGAPTGLSGMTARITGDAQPTHGKASTTFENLGTQTIQGFETRGSRITQTIPAGAIGNNEPLVSTRESWQANVQGIALTIREVDDDPRIGKRVTELVKFTLGEPDAASFQPPEGYEIVTRQTHPVGCQQTPTSSQ